MWTEEERAAARAWWTLERRAALALKRKQKPIGNRSKEWWLGNPDARRAAGKRLNGHTPLLTLEEAFAMADRLRKKLREGGW